MEITPGRIRFVFDRIEQCRQEVAERLSELTTLIEWRIANFPPEDETELKKELQLLYKMAEKLEGH